MFVLDETSWIAAEADGYLEQIETLLDNMDQLRDDNRECVYSEELFYLEVYDGKTLYELFSATGELTIPRHVQERIISAFGRLKTWSDLERPWPDELDVSIGGVGPTFAPSLAWAMKQASQGARDAVPCLIAPAVWPEGLHAVAVGADQSDVWLASDVKHPGYSRWMAVHGTGRPDEFATWLESAFPNLDFVENCTDGIKEMSLGYRDLINSIVAALSVLSDHGPRIFRESWQTAPNAFGALGVTISDENGNTKSNKVAEKEHTRTFAGRSIPFWWHIKLQPDRDRIHLDATPLHVGNKIIVGIFCRHLKT
ncbi:hypothetical protein [Xanthobacter autotrophicus]|uniref:hypothetical protein n=1 Tax=Xanthobacter autotrophicus TaxID=280 RepID=UPI00372BA9EB